MQWIRKTHEPTALREWRLKNAGDVNFGYNLLRQDRAVSNSLLAQLLTEQGRLCAYTGRRIGENSCHMEHVKPQEFCTPKETVDYANLVACYPEPNRGRNCPYGAHAKGNFPAPGEEDQFISPLMPSCETRFNYTYAGHIRPTRQDDAAAVTTIMKLNLDYEELRNLRRAAIQGTLAPNNKPLTLRQSQRLLQKFNDIAAPDHRPFQFVLTQVVRNHIRTLEKAEAAGAVRRQA